MYSVPVSNNFCAKCDIKLDKRFVDVQKHVTIQHNFECKYCNKSFITVEGIESHDNKVHFVRVKCEHCTTSYRSEEQLQLHIKAKHCLECSFCDKSFISIDDLKFHDKYVHLTVECQHCGIFFRSDKELDKHLKAKHHIECSFCDKSFTSIKQANAHVRYVHSVQCEHCDSYFRSDKELDQHINLKHCFYCPDCEKSFKSIEVRNFHYKNVHLTIECPYCDILFGKEQNLLEHIEDQHKFACGRCKQPLKSLEEKNFHQGCIYVTFDCHDCTLYFPTHKELEKHSKEHNLKRQ
ncbi:zinc finger and BTB domain-containing protein 40-like [Diabrotica virgifera virgifera]|uniref:C2H2-type domain-containing protein n=1 Tax=Diabrotica virgifera virgifera TaxID=50390 RepID=A0ABM5IPF6_DIAVI|nr:zinc finger and BTB domain-containing protein 40-like [Diabrotica virgifera virgifera]